LGREQTQENDVNTLEKEESQEEEKESIKVQVNK